MRNRKPLHLGIGLAFVVAEHFGGIVARANAGTADVDSHLCRMKKLMEKRFPSRWLQPVECVASRIGESRAKPEDLLKFFAGIQLNDVAARLAGFPCDRRLGMVAERS